MNVYVLVSVDSAFSLYVTDLCRGLRALSKEGQQQRAGMLVVVAGDQRLGGRRIPGLTMDLERKSMISTGSDVSDELESRSSRGRK